MTEESPSYLSPLLNDLPRIRRAASKRRKVFNEKRITLETIIEHEANGWQVDRRYKSPLAKKEKALDERLENKFWLLLYKMGYPVLNDGRNFTILIERKGAEPFRKQIDVLGKDEETVIVAECKASEKVTRRSLQKDIEEFANLKGPIAKAIHMQFGGNFKPKIIWIFVTENIIWSKQDRDRALGGRIQIVTEKELRYYSQIAEHLGKSARYQFLAEFLKDLKIPELSGKTVPAIRGKLGGKKFYCFVTTPHHLLKLSFVNHRSLNDPEGAPTYQRLISRSRLRDISTFLKNGGYFPNSLLVNFTRPIRFDKISQDESAGITFGTLYLPDQYRSAWIIDGQHRLYGFSPLESPIINQNILVLAFEQLPTAEEANLFVTINHEQKPVPKHLLDDLEGELKWGSDIPSERIGSISARLINLLNSDVGEPFHYRVTQQGIASTNKSCLTIPALKDALRRSFLLGRALMNNTVYDLGPLCGSKDTESLERARCALNQYFGFIRNANLTQWEKGRSGYLCTNVAIQAYILLLGSLIKYWEINTASDSREMSVEEVLAEVEEYLSPILEFLEHADDSKMKSEFQVPFGSGGPPEYYYRLCKLVNTKYSDFKPEGMETWEAEQSEENIETADHQVRNLVVEIGKCIFAKFRVIYGENKDAYWDKGVPDKDIKTKAYAKSQEDDLENRLPLESYLDVVEFKKIVEHRQNWPLFKSIFNIPEPGEKGHAKNLKWMDRINELRRISAHPSEKRHYKLEDFEYLNYIYKEFMGRAEEDARNPVLYSSELPEETNA